MPMTTHTHTPAQFLYTSCSVPGISFYAALYCLHLLALCSQAAHCLLGRAPPAEISLKNTWLQISCLSSAAKMTFCTKFSQNVE